MAPLAHIVLPDFLKVLDEANVEGMNWPANLPDMNPIEPLWDMVAQAIFRRSSSHNPSGAHCDDIGGMG